MAVSHSLRTALNQLVASGVTLYRVSKDTGINRDSLDRFRKNERTEKEKIEPHLRGDQMDTLAAYFKLELTHNPHLPEFKKPKPKPRKKPKP